MWNASFWRLDYSREQLATLDEDNLNELTSVGSGGSGFYSNFQMPYFGIVQDEAACYPPFEWLQPVVKYASLDPFVLTDLNLDCDTDDFGFVGDLNFLEASGLPGSLRPSPGEPLIGYNDWANIVLPLSDGGGPFAGPVPPDELTETQRQYMQDNFPQPPALPCLADFDGDGTVGASDLAQLLGSWGPYEPCPPFGPADFNEDCGVNAADLAQLLGSWGPCE